MNTSMIIIIVLSCVLILATPLVFMYTMPDLGKMQNIVGGVLVSLVSVSLLLMVYNMNDTTTTKIFIREPITQLHRNEFE